MAVNPDFFSDHINADIGFPVIAAIFGLFLDDLFLEISFVRIVVSPDLRGVLISQHLAGGRACHRVSGKTEQGWQGQAQQRRHEYFIDG